MRKGTDSFIVMIIVLWLVFPWQPSSIAAVVMDTDPLLCPPSVHILIPHGELIHCINHRAQATPELCVHREPWFWNSNRVIISTGNHESETVIGNHESETVTQSLLRLMNYTEEKCTHNSKTFNIVDLHTRMKPYNSITWTWERDVYKLSQLSTHKHMTLKSHVVS